MNVPPLKCLLCGFTTHNHIIMNAHEKKHFGGAGPAGGHQIYSCRFCWFDARTQDDLDNHIFQYHCGVHNRGMVSMVAPCVWCLDSHVWLFYERRGVESCANRINLRDV
ncbi:hypothetical protein EJ08DRAFT_515450 [Tothia fuscella]|uniref:C2H2-type domain-containing protein n=1 Tax=Tothia fuscella TaxID=1048955 RepID=A0A9P4NHQ1_9PEZI|nr:hypothetical protein EJ08DRAFT_515450 [Tothia fuscella]